MTRHSVTDVSGRDGALRVLHRAIHSCRLCTGLPTVAVPKVHGSAGARIVVVGQALSLAESIDAAARPFDDATGRTLRRWLGVDEATFYDPDLFYLTRGARPFTGPATAASAAAQRGQLPQRSRDLPDGPGGLVNGTQYDGHVGLGVRHGGASVGATLTKSQPRLLLGGGREKEP
jgi:hypothetical protein